MKNIQKFALTDELISETLELVKLSDEKSIVKFFLITTMRYS